MNSSKLEVILITSAPRLRVQKLMVEGVTYMWLFLGRLCLIYGGPGLSQCQKEGHPPSGIAALHI